MKDIPSKLETKTALALYFIISALICAWLANHQFHLDTDAINSSTVWHEVKEHGLSVIHDWRPTSDSWYFSVYPIHFLLFYVLGGASIFSLKLLAAAQLFFASLASTLIIYKFTMRKIAFAVLPLLCSLTYYSFEYGNASHLFSHNSTNIYGLFCIYIFIGNIYSRRLYKDLLIAFLILIAGLSDPWFQASYYLPLLLASIYSHVFIKKCLIQILIFLSSGVILFSHIVDEYFGMPRAVFSFGSITQMQDNLYWLLYSIGQMLPLKLSQSPTISVFVGVIVTIIATYCYISSSKKNAFNVVIPLSIAGIASAYVLGDISAGEKAGRFIININYLAIVYALGLALFYKRHVLKLSAYLLYVFILGLSSHAISDRNNNVGEVDGIANFLMQNKLYYGYGSYFSTHSLAVSWLTDWKVVIRPYKELSPNKEPKLKGRYQTFDNWYRDEPSNQKTFIIFSDYWDGCINTIGCVKTVKEKYGKPAEQLSYKNYTIIVYNKNLI